MSRNPSWDKRIDDGLWKRKNKDIVRLFEMDTSEILMILRELNHKLNVAKDMKKMRDSTYKLIQQGLEPSDYSRKLLEELEEIKIEEGEARIYRQIREFKKELLFRENH